MNIKRIIRTLLTKALSFFNEEEKDTTEKEVRRVENTSTRRPYVRKAPPKSSKNYRQAIYKKKENIKVGIVLIAVSLFLFSGCSKNQDLQIVHNYWDQTRTLEARKQQTVLDLYVYKKFTDINGKEQLLVYKAD